MFFPLSSVPPVSVFNLLLCLYLPLSTSGSISIPHFCLPVFYRAPGIHQMDIFTALKRLPKMSTRLCWASFSLPWDLSWIKYKSNRVDWNCSKENTPYFVVFHMFVWAGFSRLCIHILLDLNWCVLWVREFTLQIPLLFRVSLLLYLPEETIFSVTEVLQGGKMCICYSGSGSHF